jgi:hypothetical protein
VLTYQASYLLVQDPRADARAPLRKLDVVEAVRELVPGDEALFDPPRTPPTSTLDTDDGITLPLV